MRTLREVGALRTAVAEWKRAGDSVAVVPTMGALHDGHLSLVAAARGAADRVIATIFVNPRQFDNPEDLAKYPRTEDGDAAMLLNGGVDILFAPAPEVVYPAGFATSVSVSGLSDVLEGAHRPGHFDGMATVVTKLLLMTGADLALFGEKDWQQLQIVERLVTDLNIPTRIIGCPTIREADGLAMSSRNRRLAPGDRARAGALYRAIAQAADRIGAGEAADTALAEAREALVRAGFTAIDYLDCRDAADLQPMVRADRPGRVLAAAWIGGVRLIDNVAVNAG